MSLGHSTHPDVENILEFAPSSPARLLRCNTISLLVSLTTVPFAQCLHRRPVVFKGATGSGGQ